MDEIKVYPYRIRITDPILIDAFKQLSIHRAINNKQITKRIGHKVPRKIKRDGFYIKDGVIAITNPKLFVTTKQTYKTKRNSYDIEFKTLF